MHTLHVKLNKKYDRWGNSGRKATKREQGGKLTIERASERARVFVRLCVCLCVRENAYANERKNSKHENLLKPIILE